MTERGAATSDRAPACPFVAFDDDRDERADRPDHRHRCYAEIRPAPRAIAHQESYCLSPRFPACPTFQDWARREAAQARGVARGGSDVRSRGAGDEDAGGVIGDKGAAFAPAPGIGRDADATVDEDEDDEPGSDPRRDPVPPPYGFDDDDLTPRPRQPRDWAAPPPWVGRAPDPDDGPAAVPGAGLATSRWLADIRPGDTGDEDEPLPVGRPEDTPALVEAAPRPELAGLVGRPRRTGREATDRARRERPLVGQARPVTRYARGRDVDDDATPAWERPRRFEAYPSIRSRVSMPNVPRVALGALALVVAAALLLILPGLFLSKGGPAAVASPTASPSPSVSAAPTPTPAATPLTYTVKANDTLIKIANRFKVTQAAILKANPSLKNANVIAIGQVLVVPTPPPPDVIHSSTAPSASRHRRAVAGALARQQRSPPGGGRHSSGGQRLVRLIAVILPASTRNIASMCWVGAPGRMTMRSAS